MGGSFCVDIISVCVVGNLRTSEIATVLCQRLKKETERAHIKLNR